jgi:hypothetical protein
MKGASKMRGDCDVVNPKNFKNKVIFREKRTK